MRGRGLVVAAALLAGSALLAAVDACTIINGLTVPEDAAQGDGSGDAAGEAGPIDPCDHARPPPKPSGLDRLGDQTIIVVAKRYIASGADGGVPSGLDLDDSCSCPPAVAETCVGRKDHCDDVGGRDNAAGALFNALLGAPTPQKIDIEERVNGGIRKGKNTILIGVEHYNGTLDDPDVLVSIYASLGLLDGAGNNVAPQFTEDERWALDDRQFVLTATYPRATTTGYVAGGKLVASLDVTIDLSESFSIALTSSTLVADISLAGNGGKPTITRGFFAGRWPISDVLKVAGRVRLEDGGKRLCETPLAYATLKEIACQEADLVADRARDKTGARCSALSMALAFDTAPASKGSVKPASPVDDCPDARPDDCFNEGGL